MTDGAGIPWSRPFGDRARMAARPEATLDPERLAGRPGWRKRYAAVNAVVDAFVVLGAAGGALRIDGTTQGVAAAALVVAVTAIWLTVQAAGGTYDDHRISTGSDEYLRVLNGGVRTFAIVGAIGFLGAEGLPRTLLVVAVPLATALSVVHRHGSRQWINRRRATEGRFAEDLLIVGSIEHSRELVRHLRRSADLRYRITGAVVDGGLLALDVDGDPVPVLGEPGNLEEVLLNTQADSVAVTDTTVLPGGLQRLAWRLEGTGVDLLVVPAITDVAGPRISIRPEAGLPLLHVEEPDFRGARRVAKAAFDRLSALVLLVLVSPALLLIAAAIRAHSPGPAFFRQTRVGRDGREFTMWKFRTMRTGADQEVAALRHLNAASGVLFKIPDDPRRTTIGKWLRRYSIDEFPQLFNVLLGQMSLVGPRPPVPSEVSGYHDAAHRRLLVKPGMTGLWQVSGRSDLAWEESVRLDLYYVENWSIALDLTLLWKTIAAVVQGRGAY